ncbi:FKBP-type peptidyl-prolyl cis-trans isomerase [Dokdonia sp. Hel_I_53]|uniref:FKBP-type peptidyl-prolyl cis-trans isomerase n=1 Tax=Dokdonia sp. Hel_I_53 TaxID=1566287 RepID=UPI00119A7DD8|nr:hypothetical protein [Dokdonia sp. Hel_I_53]TVZ51919.1 hypothetical protein OD90_1079 [Dokdonia sp. Hel_I_53]
MKLRNYLALIAVMLICVACPNDDDSDDPIVVPPNDRGEQSIVDDERIREYLETHFYNYEEFENPPAEFDYQVRIDTISGDNADKEPILDRPELTTKVYTRAEAEQTLYILTARQGESDKPAATYADSVFMNYKGFRLDGLIFDRSPNPVWFDLTSVVDGFTNGVAGFKGAASGPIVNQDGTFDYEGYGSGAIFMPSGLAYFNAVQANIPPYSPLIFTFNTFNTVQADHDNDGILSINEDLNNNGFLFDEADNPDDDSSFAFFDPDDDNDRVLTILEIETDVDGNFVSFLDTDSDGLSNHLDNDDDGDGRPTIEELRFNSATGVVSYPDSDEDGIPDYLDSDS